MPKKNPNEATVLGALRRYFNEGEDKELTESEFRKEVKELTTEEKVELALLAGEELGLKVVTK
jgi:hypothetical protein